MASAPPKYGIQHTTVAASNAFERRQISIQTFNSENIHLQTTLTADSTFFSLPQKYSAIMERFPVTPMT